MNTGHCIRAITGVMVLVSLVLAVPQSDHRLLPAAFVGLTLVQAAFTRWCRMEDILAAAGVAKRRV